MSKQAKRTKAWSGDTTATHALDAAVKLVKANANAKFDESIEIAVNLGVDPRHADQQVRGVVNLPRAPAVTFASPSSPAAPRPMRPPRPAPRPSGPKTWWSASKAASWTSTASSPRRT